jgi:3-oxoacyl-[acyl-carrier protein] reductase
VVATPAAQLFDLTGEVALITGASSGLGWRFAEVLAAHGASVVLAARSSDKLEALKADIEAAGGKAHCVALDVADTDAIPAAFDAAEAAFGTVTILLNNAGIAITKGALNMTHDEWRKVMAIDLDAVWYIAQEAGRRMKEAGTPGTIINTASIAGFSVGFGLGAYSVAKAGVVQATRALAVELARYGIRVNAIAPGFVLTEINREFFDTEAGHEVISNIPQKRIGDVSDLDGTLLLLAAPRASGFMTGSTIVVDGGHMLTGGV